MVSNLVFMMLQILHDTYVSIKIKLIQFIRTKINKFTK